MIIAEASSPPTNRLSSERITLAPLFWRVPLNYSALNDTVTQCTVPQNEETCLWCNLNELTITILKRKKNYKKKTLQRPKTHAQHFFSSSLYSYFFMCTMIIAKRCFLNCFGSVICFSFVDDSTRKQTRNKKKRSKVQLCGLAQNSNAWAERVYNVTESTRTRPKNCCGRARCCGNWSTVLNWSIWK